jgi:hypothetical protein
MRRAQRLQHSSVDERGPPRRAFHRCAESPAACVELPMGRESCLGQALELRGRRRTGTGRQSGASGPSLAHTDGRRRSMAIGLTSHRLDWAAALALGGDAFTSWVTAGLRYARQAFCGARGHELRPGFEPHRLFLRCARCGYASPGWEVGPCSTRAPRAGVDGRSPRASRSSLERLPVASSLPRQKDSRASRSRVHPHSPVYHPHHASHNA